MIITYHGASCVKISQGEDTFVCNPVSKSAAQKPARFGADVVLVSAHHALFNGIEEVSRGDARPFVIDGPGEYEIRGATIQGFYSGSLFQEGGRNTLYVLSIDGITLVHLGALSSPSLPPQLRGELDDIDVLFVPIGGEGVLASAEAHALAMSLEPRVVVPVHFSGVGKKGALDMFLKEEGKQLAPIEKFTFRKKDLEDKEGDIVVLAS